MHDRLFAPLGLSETQLPGSISTIIPEPYSHGYLYGSSSAPTPSCSRVLDQIYLRSPLAAPR
jgi:hypothetical protein